MVWVFTVLAGLFGLWCLYVIGGAAFMLLLHGVLAVTSGIVACLTWLERKLRPKSGYDPERPLATSTPRRFK
jgi:hypothetical protein